MRRGFSGERRVCHRYKGRLAACSLEPHIHARAHNYALARDVRTGKESQVQQVRSI